MKKALPILTASLLALALAAPVQAARNTPVRAEHIRDLINELESDINRGDRRDNISEREAADLRERLAALRTDFNSRNANGLKKKEVRDLEKRVARLRERMQAERADNNKTVG